MAFVRKPVAYDPVVRPADTEKALDTITVRLFPSDANPAAIDFGGACPRCAHPFAERKWLIVVAASMKMSESQMEALAARLDELGVDRSRGDESFDLLCDCDDAHTGRPRDERGCGARFRVRVTWP